MEFLGKFHPLIVHLPIGFIVAAFGLEWILRKNDDNVSNQVIQFILGLGALSAVLSTVLGYLLSLQGGYEIKLLNGHQWTGIGVAVFSLVFYFIRRNTSNHRTIWAGWTVNLVLLTLAGHLGGSLTHGKDYLIESAPPFVKSIFTGSPDETLNVPLDSAVVFEHIIQPIMEDKCWNCHSNSKRKGGLNLQSIEGWQKGGKNGAIFTKGDPENSMILQRIYLPLSEEKHMPPAGKPQLLPSELALLQWWIEQDGSFDSKVTSIQTSARVDQIIKPGFVTKDIHELLEVPSVDPERIAELQSEGIKILALAQNSPLLEVNFARMETIDNKQLDQLSKLKKNIVRLDFSDSGVEDDQLDRLSQFPNLVHLKLQGTQVTDKGLQGLTGLKYLEFLNLHNTQISDEGLKAIAQMANLKKVFLWNTNTTPAGIKKLRASRPGLEVESGMEL